FEALAQSITLRHFVIERAPGNECHRNASGRRSESAEHRTHLDWLRRGNGRVGVAHLCPCDEASFDDELRLYAEKCRPPKDEVRELPLLDRSDLVRDAVSDRRIDRVFGDVSADAQIVVRSLLVRERPALIAHLA